MERKYSEWANERGPALFSFANVRRRRHRRFACQLISLLACFVLYIFTPLTLARALSRSLYLCLLSSPLCISSLFYYIFFSYISLSKAVVNWEEKQQWEIQFSLIPAKCKAGVARLAGRSTRRCQRWMKLILVQFTDIFMPIDDERTFRDSAQQRGFSNLSSFLFFFSSSY